LMKPNDSNSPGAVLVKVKRLICAKITTWDSTKFLGV